MTTSACKNCLWFRYLPKKNPRREEDGWCVYEKKFVNSTDEGYCPDYWPSPPPFRPRFEIKRAGKR